MKTMKFVVKLYKFWIYRIEYYDLHMSPIYYIKHKNKYWLYILNPQHHFPIKVLIELHTRTNDTWFNGKIMYAR